MIITSLEGLQENVSRAHALFMLMVVKMARDGHSFALLEWEVPAVAMGSIQGLNFYYAHINTIPDQVS